MPLRVPVPPEVLHGVGRRPLRIGPADPLPGGESYLSMCTGLGQRLSQPVPLTLTQTRACFRVQVLVDAGPRMQVKTDIVLPEIVLAAWLRSAEEASRRHN